MSLPYKMIIIFYSHFRNIKLHPNAYLPDICAKHWVSVVIANPDANADTNNTDDILAPTPAPAAAPHTMNTYKNDAKHSADIDLENYGTNVNT